MAPELCSGAMIFRCAERGEFKRGMESPFYFVPAGLCPTGTPQIAEIAPLCGAG